MIHKIRELFNRMDNHTDLLDGLQEYVEKAFSAIRKNFGY